MVSRSDCKLYGVHTSSELEMADQGKRLIKNTLFLYARMLFVMFVAFFTSRVVLDKLGVEDFGINNVVGGLAVMFVFFSSSMSNATQRFLNFELGKNDVDGAKKVFNQHLFIYGLILIVVLIAAETFGLWFVKNKLTIPENRMFAAVCVYQFTIASLCFTLLGVVFNSMIIAHEDMKIYSYLGIAEGLLKLGIAYLISVVSFDKLIFYSFALALLIVLVQFFYAIYCFRNYSECSFQWSWDKKQFKSTFAFLGWNTVGTAVYAINSQGVNILLNMFFGPVVNAARGVAYQIDNAVNNFSNNFFTAVRPQITKAYAAQDFEYLNRLFFQSSKYSFFLLWVLCLPIMMCSKTLLSLWLVEVPEWTDIFIVWVLAYSLVNVLGNPIWSIALSVGKLSKYIAIGSAVYLMVFPISYVLLKNGASPVSVFVTLFAVRCVYIMVVLVIIHSYVNFSYKEYFKKIIYPCLLVVGISGVATYVLANLLQESIAKEICVGTFAILSALSCVWFLGMTADDKTFVKSVIKGKLKK